MNVYFLVEGQRTEKKFYDAFMQYYFEGKLGRVQQVHEAVDRHYFILSANGYPKIFTHVLRNAIKDISDKNNYQHLLLCIDTDEQDHAHRQAELDRYLQQYKKDGIELPDHCQLHLMSQHRCMETWFLGNKKAYKDNPQDTTLVEYQQFYNVSQQDPEQMGILPRLAKKKLLHAQFHGDYLQRLLKERNIRYTKNMPSEVLHDPYLRAIRQRARDNAPDLASFARFLDWCQTLQQQL